MRPAASLALVFALLGTATLRAHHTGTTEVAFTARADRSFEVAVTMDAEALALKLAALQRPIEELVDVRFDGIAARLVRLKSDATTAQASNVTTASPSVVASASPSIVASDFSRTSDTATVRLAGTIPAGAETATVRTSLVYGSYALTILRDGAPPLQQWLQGLDASAPFPLADTRTSGADGGRAFLIVGAVLLVLASARSSRRRAARA